MGTRALLLPVLFAFSACGSGTPMRGDACSEEASMICENSYTGLECRDGKLRNVPCPGPDGCRVGQFDTTCDWDRGISGNNCWSRHEGVNICEYGQADAEIVCTNGTWERRPCTGCVEDFSGSVCKD